MINNKRAARGADDSSSLQSGDVARMDGVNVAATEAQAPVVEQSWDPYQVWLTRVKQPRDQRVRRQVRAASEQQPAPDLSETARLRALTIAS